MIHTVKDFNIVSEAEVVFILVLVFSRFLNVLVDVDNLICGSSAFSKPRLNIWKYIGSCTVEAYLGEFSALLC